MNWQLAKIRLAGIGPPDARFDPLDLDLFDPAGERTLDSVLWLVNGGGKTVLLRLLFTVLRPDQAGQIGSEDQQAGPRRHRLNHLGAFLIGSEPGHVVLEWRITDGNRIAAPSRLVTGLAAAVRLGRSPTELTNIRRTWYTIRSDDGAVGADDVPFLAEGRRLSFPALREALDRLARTDPPNGGRRPTVRAFDVQEDWLRHLDDLGADTEISRYQVKMNRGESSANNFLAFASDREFVRFLLDAIVDADSIAGLDASLAGVAAKIARAPDVDRELAFITALLGRLDPLIETVNRNKAAVEQRRMAERAAHGLRDALASAERVARDTASKAAERRDAATNQADELDRRVRAIEAEIREYRLVAAELRRSECAATYTRANQARDQLARDVAAWGVVEDLVRRRELTAEVEELKRALDATVEREAPLRHRRDDAAGALRGRLSAEVVLQRSAIEVERHRASREEARADAFQTDATQAAEQAAAAKANRDALEREAAAAVNRRDAAVRAGTIRAGETAKAALERTRGELAGGETRNTAISERRAAITRDIETRIGREEELATIVARAEGEITDVRARRDAGQADRAGLAADPVLRELVGGEPVDLELVGPALADRLAERAVGATRRRIELAVRSADDRRALEVLESSGLLPASLDAEEAASVLAEAGIPAKPGWRYLSDAVDPDRHGAVIATRPELAAGVVVLRTDDFDAARSAIAAAGLEPVSVLVVGRADELVSAESAPGKLFSDERIVLPPAQALHNTRAAGAELERRRERVETWDAREAAEAGAAARDRKLADALTDHLARWPAGALLAATERIRELDVRLDLARAEWSSSKEARGVLRNEDRRLADEALALSQALRRLAARASELDRLVEDEEQAAARTKGIERFRTEEEEWRELERMRQTEARAARDAVRVARDRASEARNAVVRLLDEAGRVSIGKGFAEPDEAEARRLLAVGGSLDDLRSRFRILDDELTRKTTGSPLAGRLADCETALANVVTALAARDAEIQGRAEELLSSEVGVDAERRRRAREAAEEERINAVEAAASTRGALDAAEQAVVAAQQSIDQARRPRPEIARPRDRFAADRSIAERTAERERVTAEQLTAVEARDRAAKEAETGTDRADVLAGQRDVIEGRLGAEVFPEPDLATAPFAGDRAEIRAAVRKAGAALDEARQALDDTHAAWQRAATALRHVLTEERYATLAVSPLGRRVATLAAEMTPVEATAAEVRLRADRLRSEVEELRRHRELLVSELAEATDRALRELGQAERRSRLPEGLHDWSDEPFLKIRFERPASPEDVRARLAAFVADVVMRPAERRPSGAVLLLEACEAAIVGDFAIQVLKPNDAYALRYVPIQETAVMSNGQRATAAMCLMMIIAALRAKNRPRGVPGLGVLFLDNPFGNASAGFLVGVQRRVAAALGIQPVYTTGLRDYDAIAPFRNIIALSNDQARGRMLRYVRVHPVLRSALAPRDAERGHLSAVRVLGVSDQGS